MGPRSICFHNELPAAVAPPAAVAAAPSTVAPGSTAPTAIGATSPATAAVAPGISLGITLDNVGKASVEEASVEETSAVGHGEGVDATVDGAGVDSPQATVEEDLGLGLSLTLPVSTAAPGSRVSTAAPGSRVSTVPAAIGATSPSTAAVAPGISLSITLDNVGKASAVESGVEKASVEETRGVGGGVSVDAAVDGAGVDCAQSTVEEDLGLSLSLTLAPPATAITIAAAAPAAAGAPAGATSVAPGLSISITLDNVGKAGAVESSVEETSVEET